MSIDRREFLKQAAIAGAVIAAPGAMAQMKKPNLKGPKPKGKPVDDLAAPKMEKVRCAFIGVGARGPGHLDAVMACEGTEIVAICDNHKPSLDRALKMVTDAKRPAAVGYGKDEWDYRNMLDRNDIDAVFIATPWEWHVPMAVDAMKRGKHAFVEVPAAITVDDCWNLVETSEQTQKHCMMMENVNYGREELMVLNMARLGVFGELLHGEAAYIHDLRGQMHEIEHGTGSWRTLHYTKRNGNLYPTHGLGPVAAYMGINRGDRFDFMSSVSSNARVREIYAKEHFPAGHPRRQLKFVCGDINTSIIRTLLGKTIMVQWDEQLPRPYTRHNLLQGTKGCWGGFPNRLALEPPEGNRSLPGSDSWMKPEKLQELMKLYDHPLWTRLAGDAAKHGGHGGMDFVMIWRIIYCLRNGLPVDQDVYDAAAWSVITPLSEWSVANRGQSIDVPDFTRGRWKDRKPVELGN